MSDKEILKKLYKIAVNQQKIQNRILEKLGFDMSTVDAALRKLGTDTATKWLADNNISGDAKVFLSRDSAEPTATKANYDVDVKLTVNSQEAKAKAEDPKYGLISRLRNNFSLAAADSNSPLFGSSAEFTITVIVGTVSPIK